jgi:hypothetical protein
MTRLVEYKNCPCVLVKYHSRQKMRPVFQSHSRTPIAKSRLAKFSIPNAYAFYAFRYALGFIFRRMLGLVSYTRTGTVTRSPGRAVVNGSTFHFTVPRCKAEDGLRTHGHGHGHGIFILATHPHGHGHGHGIFK